MMNKAEVVFGMAMGLGAIWMDDLLWLIVRFARSKWVKRRTASRSDAQAAKDKEGAA